MEGGLQETLCKGTCLKTEEEGGGGPKRRRIDLGSGRVAGAFLRIR